MTRPDDFDRQLASWLEAEADFPVPAILRERVLEPTTRRRPRPAVLAWIGSYWVSGVPAGRLPAMRWALLIVVAGVILALLGAALSVGSRLRHEAPPSGLPLVYARDGDIIMADRDGANPVVIADGAPSNDRSGTWYTGGDWAPDGSHFVYNEVRPGQVPSVITHISDASGRRLASLLIEEPEPGATAPPPPSPNVRPIGDRQLKSTWATWWSPDSTLLATFPWTAESIRIFGLDGRLRYDLPLPDGYEMWRELGFRWAPDGRSVLVVITSQGPRADLSGREVWQLSLDGSAPRRLSVDNPLASWHPVASHDGRRVAFSGHNSPFDDGPIFVANGDGSDPKPVAHVDPSSGTAGYPMWSPDDTQLAYHVGIGQTDRVVNQEHRVEVRYELRVVDLRTREDRLVVIFGDDDSSNRGWSADGRLYLRAYEVAPVIDGVTGPSRQADRMALWSVRPDGRDLRLLVENVDSFGVRP